MLLFLSLHVGRYSDEKSVKEKWDFGTSWNWFKMKVLIIHLLLKDISGNILVFRKHGKNKAKQLENVPCFGFGTICIIWGGVLVLVKLQTTLQPSLKLAYLHRCFYVL